MRRRLAILFAAALFVGAVAPTGPVALSPTDLGWGADCSDPNAFELNCIYS